MDVGVYISGNLPKLALPMELGLENDLQDALHVPVDVRVLNKAPVPFVYNVLKSGRVVVDKDKCARADFEGWIYKRYFDLRHLLKEYLREIINAPI